MRLGKRQLSSIVRMRWPWSLGLYYLAKEQTRAYSSSLLPWGTGKRLASFTIFVAVQPVRV